MGVEQSTKMKILSGMIWKLLERGGTQGVQFVVQIVLARLLLPEDYGLIAMTVIFITMANIFVQSGFNIALIQKKNTTEADFSSVFYLSLLVAGILYMILFFAAPPIAAFFGEPQLVPVLRILSITLFFGAFSSIQNAVIARGMQFKKLFFSSLGAIVVSGAVGIAMAYTGYGVWALVGQQITNQLLVMVILFLTLQWRPRLLFAPENVKGLFSYGWKIMLASLMSQLYIELRSLIIGKMYNAEMLGFYNRGKHFPSLIINNINGSIQAVMLPALSSQQDNRPRVKDMVRRSIMTSSFFVFPVMVGLAVVAEPLVLILLTAKWLPVVPFLQIYCLICALWSIQTANLQAIKALGHSDIILKLVALKLVLGLAVLGVTVFYGVYAIALGGAVVTLLSTVIDSYPNRRLLDYSYKEQWRDIMPSLLLSLVMGAAVYSLNGLGLADWVTLTVQIPCGVVIYFGLAYLFKLESLVYLINIGRELYSKTGARC